MTKTTMKKLTNIILLTVISVSAAFAQTADEKAILQFINDYDRAYLTKDLTWLEANLADNYAVVMDGKKQNRAQAFADLREKIKTPSKAKLGDLKSVNESVRVAGDFAYASGIITWKDLADGNTETHSGQEHYTLVLERQNGKWKVVSEHISAVRRDSKPMEAEVLTASAEYTEMIRRRDAAVIERVLTEEYFLTNENGQTRNKTQELERVKNSPYKLESLTASDQKVRIYGNNIAVETGRVNYKGTDKDGKSSAGIERYTTVWIRRDGRWQIVSDHLSDVKE